MRASNRWYQRGCVKSVRVCYGLFHSAKTTGGEQYLKILITQEESRAHLLLEMDAAEVNNMITQLQRQVALMIGKNKRAETGHNAHRSKIQKASVSE